MQNMGITGSALELFTSYLSYRNQSVKINNTLSHSMSIKCGVPQGTTLSPILFNIQLSDIQYLPLKSNVVCFADDTVLKCSGDTWEEVFSIIMKDINVLENWLSKNNLFLNYEKTAVILHSQNMNTLPTKTEIIFHDNKCNTTNKCQCKILNIVKNTKYLGLEMCSNMKWNEQIFSLANKENDLYGKRIT